MTDSPSDPPPATPSRWQSVDGSAYDHKWEQMAAAGHDPHGEVAFVQRFNPTTVLDAGCGTGRVAIELAARGIDVVGVDLDGSMIERARAKAPALEWYQHDLATLDLASGSGRRQFDCVVMAGNIMLFVAAGTEAAVVQRCAEHVAPGGVLISGFSLGRGVTVEQYEQWVDFAGLVVEARAATWDGDPFESPGSYLVSSARKPV